MRWVRLLYQSIRSFVLINGYSSPPVFPSRGVRQGCPLSPLLYVLTMEVLAASIRAHPDIVGLSVPGLAFPLPVLSLYADDTSVVVASEPAIEAVFTVYALFEKGSGSKLDLGKCEGLWLGSWRGRPDAPVPISCTSAQIKVLGVYIGHGDLETANWRPRLDSVKCCLDAWRGRTLSFQGRAVVLNALTLARVWYVASLAHMPAWVHRKLVSLVFSFFWHGKRDLVRRSVMVQPRERGGFGVVSVALKVQALLVQWVRRFDETPNSWVSLLTYWCFDRFGVGPRAVFANPGAYHPSRLPPFYGALLSAWVALGGAGAPPWGLFVRPAGGPLTPVAGITCRAAYALLLQSHADVPHCVDKFAGTFGDLHWSTTWKSLAFMPLDRHVVDLAWRVAHGVLYTAERLAGFGYAFDLCCFCGQGQDSAEHLFFSCPLAQSGIAWIQSLLSPSFPSAPSISLTHVLFGFSPAELRVVPRVFSYLIHVLNFLVWSQRNDHRFRSRQPSAVTLTARLRSRLRFFLPLFFRRFRSVRRRRWFARQWGANGVIGLVEGDSFRVVV